MKKSVFFLAALVCMALAVVTITTYARDKIILGEQLPATAQTFIQKNFPGQTVAFAKVDKDLLKTTYEIHLNNGVELEFNKDGTWDKVDCNFDAVPAEIVPTTIANYVNTNFAATTIVKIDKKRYGYDVELSNELELKFNKQGLLKEIDD